MIAGVEQVFHLAYEVVHWTLSWVIPNIDLLPTHERGVKISGKRVKELVPGFYIWHQHLSCVYKDNVKRKVRNLAPQTLTTRDGCTVRVGGVLIFHISNIVTWLIENEDPDTGLSADAGRILRDFIRCRTFEEIQQWDPKKRNDDDLTRSAQAELGKDFGVRVRYLGLTIFAETVAKDHSISGGGASGWVDDSDEDEEDG